MNTQEIKQRTQEWFESRKGRVTASSVGAILGLSPHMTSGDVLRMMVREYHGAEREFKGNAATEWGTINEDAAKWEFQIEHGITISECGFYTWGDWAGASPDGILNVEDEGKDLTIIEIKCPYGLKDNKEPVFKTIEEQPHYYAQIQFQLYCADMAQCYFYQWTPYDTKTEIVGVNDEWLRENIPKLEEFHKIYLSELNNPEHLEPRRKSIETIEARQLLSEYDRLSHEIDLAEQAKKDIMDDLVKIAGDKDALICGRKLTKVEKSGAVSYAKAIKALLPSADLEPYRGKPSIFWKLT
jgi:putative phage-type endonuclease